VRRRIGGHQGHHRAEQDGGAERFGPEQQQGAGDVRAVREARRNDPPRVEVVVDSRRSNEVGELAGPELQILLVEHSFREPPEEPRHAALEYLAARAEHAGLGRERARQRQQIHLGPAGSVQHEQRRRVRPFAGRRLVDVLKAELLGHGWRRPGKGQPTFHRP